MANYVKLFGSILRSSIWRQKTSIRCVWITMLAMADRDGIVEASVGGLADAAKVSEEIAKKALALFLSPDPDSKTPDFEGRRIEAVTRGWRLLNFEAYREMQSVDDRKAKNAARQQRHRDRQKASGVTPDVTDRNVSSRSVTPRDACCSDLLSSSGSDPPQKPPDQTQAPARSEVRATDRLTGSSICRLFGDVRCRVLEKGFQWQSVQTDHGKAAAMADLAESDPEARRDVERTMVLFFERVKAAKYRDSGRLAESPALAFGLWCSEFTALREQLHGAAPKPPATAPAVKPWLAADREEEQRRAAARAAGRNALADMNAKLAEAK